MGVSPLRTTGTGPKRVIIPKPAAAGLFDLSRKHFMRRKTSEEAPDASLDWPAAIHRALKSQRVRQISYVPDAGHKRLIELCHADRSMAAVPLTTEEDGIGLAAGAWLCGERAALLLQSRGVGNCINALTLSSNCGFPLLMLVTLRGDWGEFNPWQIPMGKATPEALRLGGVHALRLEQAEDAFDTVTAAATLVFGG